MNEYRELTYAAAVHDFLTQIAVGEEKVFDVECPKRDIQLPARLARAALSRVAKDMGIKITCRYERAFETLIVKRLR